MNDDDRIAVLRELKGVVVRLNKVITQVEQDQYRRVDVIQQLQLAQSSLRHVCAMILDRQYQTCQTIAIGSTDPLQRAQALTKIGELFCTESKTRF